MMEYSPMQNVQKGKKYPACWLTGGLHDPRVAYWEPAKVSDWQLLLQVTEDGNQFICVRDMTELYQCDVFTILLTDTSFHQFLVFLVYCYIAACQS